MSTSLPLEILRTILREATVVPSAFTYPLIEPEVYEFRVAAEISASYPTKLALSLVSRTFHTLVTEFLYEIILLRSFTHIAPLVEILRRPEGLGVGDGPTNGWWVRRLEVRLAYDGKGWSPGGGSRDLWGLLPSCPNLLDLRCSISYYVPGTPERVMLFPVGEEMLAGIARGGVGLRVLELSGATQVGWEAVERLVGCLPVLELCTLKMITRDEVVETGGDWAVVDEDASHHLHPFRSRDTRAVTSSSPRWPSPPPTCSPTLPRLRAFWFSSLHHLPACSVAAWRLPSLEKFAVEYHCPSAECFSHLTRALANPYLASAVGLTFIGPTINLWAVVGSMPRLCHLRIGLPSADHNLTWWSSTLPAPHPNLRGMMLFVPSDSHPDTLSLAQALDCVRMEKVAGRLPVLAGVKVRAEGRCKEFVERVREGLERVGLALEVRPGRLVK